LEAVPPSATEDAPRRGERDALFIVPQIRPPRELSFTFLTIIILFDTVSHSNSQGNTLKSYWNFTLDQAWKTQIGSRSTALPFFNLGAKWRWVVNATP
jgi:hypothetical protein